MSGIQSFQPAAFHLFQPIFSRSQFLNGRHFTPTPSPSYARSSNSSSSGTTEGNEINIGGNKRKEEMRSAMSIAWYIVMILFKMSTMVIWYTVAVTKQQPHDSIYAYPEYYISMRFNFFFIALSTNFYFFHFGVTTAFSTTSLLNLIIHNIQNSWIIICEFLFFSFGADIYKWLLDDNLIMKYACRS